MSVVLDASALLAYLQEEPGRDAVAAVLPDSFISAVNWAEVVGKTRSADVQTEDLLDVLARLGLTVEPFSRTQAETAGRLLERTRPLGLSLADRACLALAIDRADPAYTADRVWLQLRADVRVEAIR
ncbi:MAG: type II toxin-antitoxin system VapC family toxin [Gammaproteobacteria bacterium]|nr:type II toxin-antitoxin system VapC family toxin [Gammaproteobacteria bacterium]